MRNKDRIPIILNKINEAWITVPDYRLGQLFFNLTGQYDCFHVEDNTLENALDAFIKEDGKKKTR